MYIYTFHHIDLIRDTRKLVQSYPLLYRQKFLDILKFLS